MHVGEWCAQRARIRPDRIFLKQAGLCLSNREFDGRVNRMARVLLAGGLRKGDRVAVLMHNGSAFLEVFFACAKTGAVLVPLNHQLAGPELERIVADCGPRVLVHSPCFTAAAERLCAAGPSVERLLRHAGEPHAAVSGLEAPGDAPDAAGEPEVPWDVRLGDPLLIMFTSGTTGTLKGAVLTHENFLYGAVQNLLSYGIGAGCTSLVVAPLFHIGALVASATSVIYAGGSLVIRDFDNPSEIVHLIVREKVNYLFAVPVMYAMMRKAPAWRDADFSHVHVFIAGGAPMPVALIRQYQEEKGVRFVQGYGMTETLRVTSLDLEDAGRKAGSIGKELFHTRVCVVDDAGREAPPGVPGELVVRGPTVFAGYWNNPEATARALRGGWFHTGDLGRRDEEGYLYLVGRKNDLIICAGENIYAAEVERAMETLAPVAEVAVVGMPDPVRGEVAAAFVVLKEAGSATEDALTAPLRDRLAHYKIPRKVLFVDALPRTASGKIHKDALKRKLDGKEEPA